MGMFVVAPASSFSNHHHHHHHHEAAINIAGSAEQINGPNLGVGMGVGVIPLLTTAPCLGSHQNMEDQHQDLLNSNNNSRHHNNKVSQIHQFWQKSTPLDHINNNNNASLSLVQGINPGGGGGGGGGGSNSNIGSGSSSGTTTCQDCGNQAKKDCSHRRCRTCCKSRGYDCATHVKSTWVPAARRRERHIMAAVGGAGSTSSTSGVKKPRLSQNTTSHTSTSNTTPPRSFDTTSSHQEASFKEGLPTQVREQAVFKCVRVTTVDGGEDEYAYQATVKIGGHLFKGFLYDQGLDQTREGINNNNNIPNLSELHLGGATSGGGGGRNGGCTSSTMLDPNDVYAASGGGGAGGLLGGSSYGNPMN